MDIKITRTKVIILLVSLFVTSSALADQNDPRLDTLFKSLQSDDSIVSGEDIADRIWDIWIETPDPSLESKMKNGVLAMSRHNFDTALKSFDTIIETAPDYAEGWNKRATVYFMMGQYNSSMSDVHRTLGLEPRHFGALSGMGLIFMATGNDQRALQAFQEAIKVNPHMPTVHEYINYLKEKIERNTI